MYLCLTINNPVLSACGLISVTVFVFPLSSKNEMLNMTTSQKLRKQMLSPSWAEPIKIHGDFKIAYFSNARQFQQQHLRHIWDKLRTFQYSGNWVIKLIWKDAQQFPSQIHRRGKNAEDKHAVKQQIMHCKYSSSNCGEIATRCNCNFYNFLFILTIGIQTISGSTERCPLES